MTLIDDFAQLVITQNRNLVKIGTGTAHNVWVDKRAPTVAYKIEKLNALGGANHEYNVVSTLLGNYDLNATSTLCKVITFDANQLQTDLNTYISMMKRYVNPTRITDYSAVALLSHKRTSNAIIPFRGVYIGISELRVMLKGNTTKLNALVSELGTCMAKLHYRCLNDGNDIEILLDKDASGEIIAYISDFNVSNPITDHSNITSIRGMVNSLKFSPTLLSDTKLYDYFVSAYLIEADLVGSSSYAQVVINALQKSGY
jgi:hypothetical protein